MTEKEVMKFVIERSNDPIIKNPVLREAMNKDLGPRIKASEGGLIDDALNAYKNYLKMRSDRPSKKRFKEIPFNIFFEEYGRENFAGGQLVSNTVDGSRPGYSGQPKKYDPKKVLEAIENSNSKLKYNTLEMLAKELDGVADSSHLHAIIKREKFPKLDSYANKAERAFLELFDDPNKTPQQLKNPLHKIADMMGLSENTKLRPNEIRGIRIDNISKALKESKLFNYAEDVKPVIDKLSNVNFIKKLDRASANKNPWTMEDIYFSIDNNTSLKGPRGDAERLMQYAIRHNAQAGKKATFTLIDNKTGQKIKNTSNIERYLDVSFKDPSGKIYDMDYLERNGRKDPMFKEYFETQDKLTDMKQRTTWPDGSLIIDRTGKNVTFGTYAGDMYTHGYGYTNPYRRFPYDVDHSDLKKHPFKNLQILPTRINVATGAADNWNKPDIKKKIGADYFRQLPVDDLMMKEKALGEKILIFDKEGKHVGKKLNTSYGAAKIKSGTPLHNKLMKFCPKDVGGTAGVCSLDEALRGMKEESKMLQSGKLNKPQAEQIAKKFNAVRRVGTGLAKGSKLMSWLGPYGLGGEIALEGMFVANDMLENGMTYKEALSNSVLRYALPKNQRERLEYNEDRNRKILGNDTKGLAADYVSGLKKQEDLIKSYNKFNKMNETEGVGDIDGSDIYDYKDIYKAEKDFDKDYDRMSPTYGKNIFDIVKYGSPEQQAFAAKEEGFDVRAMENRMEYDKKLLGPLGKEDFYSQAQLDMLDAKALSESKRIGERSNEIKTQEVANFGGVANMAHGGIMNLRRKK
jgi:hypothetical protein